MKFSDPIGKAVQEKYTIQKIVFVPALKRENDFSVCKWISIIQILFHRVSVSSLFPLADPPVLQKRNYVSGDCECTGGLVQVRLQDNRIICKPSCNNDIGEVGKSFKGYEK